MTEKENIIEGKAEVKDPVRPFSPERFAAAYQIFCEKEGGVIVARPEYIARDDGTFSLVVKLVPVELTNRV